MRTTFLLIRHGQTAWNKDVRFRGRADLPLDDTGRVQARRVADRLRSQPIRAVYASPLSRAVETARPLADALNLPVQPRPGLLDIDYGEWQGLTPEEVSARWPELHRLWQQSPDRVAIPGGESLPVVQRRAMTALASLTERHGGETVVLVGHQVVNKAILLAVLGMPLSAFWRIPQDTGCINAFAWESDAWSLLYLNDTSHLASSQK